MHVWKKSFIAASFENSVITHIHLRTEDNAKRAVKSLKSLQELDGCLQSFIPFQPSNQRTRADDIHHRPLFLNGPSLSTIWTALVRYDRRVQQEVSELFVRQPIKEIICCSPRLRESDEVPLVLDRRVLRSSNRRSVVSLLGRYFTRSANNRRPRL